MTIEQHAPPSTQRCEQLLREIVSIRSVVGDDTTAHVWLSERLREAGMRVEHYAVEGRRTPLVLGIFEGHGSKPGVLFDAHYDTVGAVPGDWSRDPWLAHVEDGVLYGARCRRQQGLAGRHAHRRRRRPGIGHECAGADLLHVRLRRRGFVPRIHADGGPRRDRARRHRLLRRGHEQSCGGDRLPRHLHVEDHSDRADGPPDRARARHQRDRDDGTPRARSGGWPVEAPERRLAMVRTPRHDERDPHAAGRWLGDPGRCDCVLSVLSPPGTTLLAVRDAIEAFLRELEATGGPARFESKVLPMGAGRIWLRPGEVDPEHEG